MILPQIASTPEQTIDGELPQPDYVTTPQTEDISSLVEQYVTDELKLKIPTDGLDFSKIILDRIDLITKAYIGLVHALRVLFPDYEVYVESVTDNSASRIPRNTGVYTESIEQATYRDWLRRVRTKEVVHNNFLISFYFEPSVLTGHGFTLNARCKDENFKLTLAILQGCEAAVKKFLTDHQQQYYFSTKIWQK